MKKCAYLLRGEKAVCRALERTYFPSLFQLFEYCRSREYRKCPFYLRGIITSKGTDGSAIGLSSLLRDLTSR